jgi:hypothetical protein
MWIHISLQINHTLVPASADPSGKWNFCKADPAECSIDQLKVFQGKQINDAMKGMFLYGILCHLLCDTQHCV